MKSLLQNLESQKKLKDMGDGSFAEVIYVTGVVENSGDGGGVDTSRLATSVKQQETIDKLESILAVASALSGNTDAVETLQSNTTAAITALREYVDGIESLVGSLGSNTDQLESLLSAIGLQTDQIEPLLSDIKIALGDLSKKTDVQPVSMDGVATNATLVECLNKLQSIISALSDGTQKVQVESLPAVSVGNFPALQPVSAESLPLPAGAAVAAKQPALDADGGALAHVTNFPETQPVSAAQLPLPAGAAKDSSLTDGTQKAQVTALPTAQRTPSWSRATVSGSVAAGAYSVSFTAVSGAVSVAGVALNAGESISWSAPLGDTLAAIAYTVASGELIISKVI